MENREEIFDRPEAASAEGAAPVESQPRQSEETSRKAMEGLRKAGEKLSAVAAVGGILSGILSFIFGIVMLSQGVGSYANNMQYGGDAYTGIQNAAAQTARNVKALATIAKDGFGFLADRSVLFCAAAQRQAQKRLSGTVFCSAWEMVKGFDAGWADLCPAKPCLPSSIYGILNRNTGRRPIRAASLCFDPQIYGSEEAAAIMRCGGCFSAGAPAAGAPDRRRLPARSPTASGVLRPRWGRRAASR